MELKLDPRFAIDIETTGLAPQQGDRVIEIAAVPLDGGYGGSEFSRLINCGRAIPHKVERISGISTLMLRSEPEPREVIHEFRAFVGDATLVAYNADFERMFLRLEFGRLGWQFRNRITCALKLARQAVLDLPDYRLQTLARHLFWDCRELQQAHRALPDARLTARVWKELQATR